MSTPEIAALVVVWLVGIVPAGAFFEWIDSHNSATPLVAVVWPGTVPFIGAIVALERLAKIGSGYVRNRRARPTGDTD